MITPEKPSLGNFKIKFDILRLNSQEKAYITWYGITDPDAINLLSLCRMFHPVSQILGVCVTSNNRVLITSIDGIAWGLPGGTTEKGETLEKALIREVREEENSTIQRESIYVLGIQKVEIRDINGFARPVINQARVLCYLDKVGTTSGDPAIGTARQRKFVPIDELNNYLAWGKVGDEIVQTALKFLKIKRQ